MCDAVIENVRMDSSLSVLATFPPVVDRTNTHPPHMHTNMLEARREFLSADHYIEIGILRRIEYCSE